PHPRLTPDFVHQPPHDPADQSNRRIASRIEVRNTAARPWASTTRRSASCRRSPVPTLIVRLAVGGVCLLNDLCCDLLKLHSQLAWNRDPHLRDVDAKGLVRAPVEQDCDARELGVLIGRAYAVPAAALDHP